MSQKHFVISGQFDSNRFQSSVRAIQKDPTTTGKRLEFDGLIFDDLHHEKITSTIIDLLMNYCPQPSEIMFSACSGHTGLVIPLCFQVAKGIKVIQEGPVTQEEAHAVGLGISTSKVLKKLCLRHVRFTNETLQIVSDNMVSNNNNNNNNQKMHVVSEQGEETDNGRNNYESSLMSHDNDKSCPILQELYLGYSSFDGVNSDTFQHFLSQMRHLDVLELTRCKLQDEQLAKMITSVANSIQHLYLFGNNFSISSMDAVATVLAMPKCKLSLLECDEQKRLLPSLSPLTMVLQNHNKSLKKLSLSKNKIMTQDMALLAQALCHNTTLEDLDLNHCQITDEGAIAFGEKLHGMMGLKRLAIGGQQPQITMAGARVLVRGLKENVELVDFILPHRFQMMYNTRIIYYTTLNVAGRRIMRSNQHIPPGLWVLVLKRANKVLNSYSQGRNLEHRRVYCHRADIINYFLRGPILCEM